MTVRTLRRPASRRDGTVSVDDFGADPTGVIDSTAAFNAALASLPTTTIYANPISSTGSSAAFPTGTVHLSVGTYRLGTSIDTTDIGPFVNLIGAGHSVTKLAYYGSGRCLSMHNSIKPLSDTFDHLAVFAGRLDGFTVDGTNSVAGSIGIDYGDTEGGVLGPDLWVQNFAGVGLSPPTLSLGATNASGGTFSAATYYWLITATTLDGCGETLVSNEVTHAVGANGTQVLTWTPVTGATGYNIYRSTSAAATSGFWVTSIASGATTTYTDTGTSLSTFWYYPTVNRTGSVGLRLSNKYSWTENIWGRVNLYNNTNGVCIDAACNPSGDISFEYNDLTFKVYSFQNQHSVSLRNGTWFNNGSLKIRANHLTSVSANNGSLLYLHGKAPAGHVGSGNYSLISQSHIEIQAETSVGAGGGSNGPMTIRLGSQDSNAMYAQGVIAFNSPNGWQMSNWFNGNRFNIQFSGIVMGETNLNPANTANACVIGTQISRQGKMFTDGTLSLQTGDFFNITLTQSITVAMSQAIAGSQTKKIILKQAAAGGFTVTWPKPGTPSLSTPAIYWPGGTAPTMSVAANAIDMYELHTTDGIKWYGQVISQAAS